MSSNSKFDVDKLNIDGSLKKLCFHISKFNVSGCDFCMNDGTLKAINNVFIYFLMGSFINMKGFNKKIKKKKKNQV